MTIDNMRVIQDFPPNYQDIVAVLGDVSKSNPVFCYGDIIYNPFKREITPDVEYHESIHARQQAQFTTPDMWYMRYLTDRDFRFVQEIEAYGEQFKFGKERVKSVQADLVQKGQRLSGGASKITDAFLDSLATELSGEAYGTLCSFGEARSKIRNYAKVLHNTIP